MVVLQYPAVLERDDNGTWLVTFPDFDDAVTFGDTREQALARAVDALETVIISHMNHKLAVPTPSPGRGKPLVSISPLTAAKALLYSELRAQNISIRQLAQKLRGEEETGRRCSSGPFTQGARNCGHERRIRLLMNWSNWSVFRVFS